MPKKSKEKKAISPYQEMNLPQSEVNDLFDNVVDDYTKGIPKEKPHSKQLARDYLDEIPTNNYNQRTQSQPLMFQDEGKENLIADLLKVDWERVEHIIRGHKPQIDPETGDEYFVKLNEHYLNDYGVNSVLHFLSFYLSKDIKLGRFSADQVEIRMQQFSTQFTDFFYDNMEEFGLDTPKKKKMSKMFVQSVIDLVDASYSCAIEGKTIELMLKQFSVMQQEPLYDMNYPPTNQNQPKQKTPIMQRIFG